MPSLEEIKEDDRFQIAHGEGRRAAWFLPRSAANKRIASVLTEKSMKRLEEQTLIDRTFFMSERLI